MTLTQRLAEIRERVNAATEGPWFAEHGMAGKRATHLCATDRDWHTTASLAHFCYQGPKLNNPNRVADVLAQEEADIAFAAHARADIPFLLSELEKHREVLRELIGAGDNSVNPSDGNDVAAMFRFADACAAARSLLES